MMESNYVILDAARIFGEIDTAQKLQNNFLSLYKGHSEELLSSVAPYIFAYQPKAEFGKWLLEKGWGNSWGIFITTKVGLLQLQMHFRNFLMVRTEQSEELYFRFYDPRVLRIFLPTCDQQQLKDFFGPISSFAMEDEDPEYVILYKYISEQLVKERVTREEFWESIDADVTKPHEYVPAKSIIKEEEPVKEIDVEKPKPYKPNNGWSFLVD